MIFYVFFFNDTATTEIYTLSLHDALPILGVGPAEQEPHRQRVGGLDPAERGEQRRGRPGHVEPCRALDAELQDRKSTRLNSSHANISYAVFCLKKKKIKLHFY